MTIIKTAKQIKDEYLMSSVDSEQPQYVSLQEYETLAQKRLELGETVSRIMNDNHELLAGLAKRDNDYRVLRAILQQWAEISPALTTMNNLSRLVAFEIPELAQLVAATKVALDAQSGNPTSDH